MWNDRVVTGTEWKGSWQSCDTWHDTPGIISEIWNKKVCPLPVRNYVYRLFSRKCVCISLSYCAHDVTETQWRLGYNRNLAKTSFRVFNLRNNVYVIKCINNDGNVKVITWYFHVITLKKNTTLQRELNILTWQSPLMKCISAHPYEGTEYVEYYIDASAKTSRVTLVSFLNRYLSSWSYFGHLLHADGHGSPSGEEDGSRTLELSPCSRVMTTVA